MEVQQQAVAAGNSQDEGAGRITTQPDGTFTIPLITTPSGTNFFRTQSGSQYTIIENPPTPGVTTAVKQVSVLFLLKLNFGLDLVRLRIFCLR